MKSNTLENALQRPKHRISISSLSTRCQWVVAFMGYPKEKVSFTVYDSSVSGKKEICRVIQCFENPSARWSSCILSSDYKIDTRSNLSFEPAFPHYFM